jgi:murein DD-endopeptidase MepM/ murein hydrolase activator NlpD
LFQRSDDGLGAGGNVVALSLDQAVGPTFGRRRAKGAWLDRFDGRLAHIDLVPDLGARIGSSEWWRGFATCMALCSAAVALSPGFDRAIPGLSTPVMTPDQWDKARAQTIAPLAWGGDTGRRMAATDAVVPLAETPERPSIDLTATIGQGDGFARVLERAGVGKGEAATVAGLIRDAIPASDIKAGTRMDITLGRRPNRRVARPLDSLAFRARFDLKLAVERVDGTLRLNRIPIAVDNTPLRIQGKVGSSLYRSARAAGAPAKAIEAYLRAIATKLSVSRDIGSDATFDMIIEHRRAETGEVEVGQLMYAGLERGKRKTQLLKWDIEGRTDWFEASGVGERRGTMLTPVNGRQSSGYGMRRHPILGYSRMHKGLDFAAPHGAPIYAASDGTVTYSGRNAGYGNYVRIKHAGGLATSYAHMSRIVARSGARVRQGQVIGYVGSTGLSTGPHLHYELYKNGVAVNPKSVKFTSTAQLSGAELRQFKAKLSTLLAVRPGAALARTEAPAEPPKPVTIAAR